MSAILIFFKPRHDLTLTSEAVARELVWGEEVEGLVDLPIREVLDRLKAEFPEHRETPGLLIVEIESGRFETTWTWQHVKVELHEVSATDQQRLMAVLEAFGCQVFEG
jgi:hypothetical protein